MGKVMMSGIVPYLKAPVSYKVNFEDNDWATIIDACKKNAVPDTWLVGDQKTMTINGTDYLIDIVGKNHDEYADGSGRAPLTFQMHNLYNTLYGMNSTDTISGGWESCLMRNEILTSIMSVMPIEVQCGIRLVKKISENGKNTLKTTDDKLFLISEAEIGLLEGYGYLGNSAAGTQYEYYKAGNSRVKKNSISSLWSLRSIPTYGSVSGFLYIDGSGECSVLSPTSKCGVSFAFCF